ncbi:MAG: ABC transporter substrate-binding protein [Bacillota bacterium]
MAGPGSGRRARALVALVSSAVLAAILAPAPAGCAWRRSELHPAFEGGPITIGVPLPLTGVQAVVGQVKRNAYEMAAEEINAGGGVDGRPLVLLIRDTGGEPGSAAALAEEMITGSGVTFLIGEYSSAASLAVAGVAQKYGVPYLIDSAAADGITQNDWRYVFRLNPPAGLLALGLTGFLKEVVKPRAVAIIYESGEFGASAARAMRNWCWENWIDVPVYQSYDPGIDDFTPILARIKGSRPDVVFMVSYLMDASMLVRQARAQGVTARLFAGAAGGFALPEFILEAGPAAEHVVAVAPWAPTLRYPGTAEFAETYRARYGQYPTYHAAQAYAAVHVAADVLERAASTDPERLRVALVDTGLMTVFGPIRFESFGKYKNQATMNPVILQVLGGRHETIWPPEVATAAYVFPDPAGTGAEPPGAGD